MLTECLKKINPYEGRYTLDILARDNAIKRYFWAIDI